MQLTDLAPWGESLRIAVEVIGTIAFALSGILAGVQTYGYVWGSGAGILIGVWGWYAA